MRRLDLVESQATGVEITIEQAEVLAALGERLAAHQRLSTDDEATATSVIGVSRGPGGKWKIVIREAIGIIAVDGLQIVVAPKVPQDHFLYLAQQSELLPRIESFATRVDPTSTLWEVVAHWYLQAAKRVVRGELAKGYTDARDELELARGRILPLDTAYAFYQGRPVVACEFEEFTEDIPLNRVLRAAADQVAASSLLDRLTRREAVAVVARMAGVGPLRESDLRVEVDRLTARYRDALAFAKLLLRAGGTQLTHGQSHGWCFLIRTPDVVEAGVRAVLGSALKPRWGVQKGSLPLKASGLTLNPDLVFARGLAVGDVKYKLLSSEWMRADLYQSVAFAAGFETDFACVIGFVGAEGSAALPPRVKIGQISVQPFGWSVTEGISPEAAGQALCVDVADWLREAARQRASAVGIAA